MSLKVPVTHNKKLQVYKKFTCLDCQALILDISNPPLLNNEILVVFL